MGFNRAAWLLSLLALTSCGSTSHMRQVASTPEPGGSLITYEYTHWYASADDGVKTFAGRNCSGRLHLVGTRTVSMDRTQATYRCVSSSPSLAATPTPIVQQPALSRSALSLNELVATQCNARGWSQGSASYSRCQQELRVAYAAAGLVTDPTRAERMIRTSTLAAQRCDAAGLRRGTPEFANCSVAAQSNIVSEAETSPRVQQQQTIQAPADADRQRAIEMAQADAERARRQQQGVRMMELGLGMAAGGASPSSTPSTQRSYNINGRVYHCNTTGAFTNCF